MTGFSDKAIQSVQELLFLCDHILEEEYSRQAILEMQNTLKKLQTQSEKYREQLLDQQMHSKSGRSRGMASLMLAEEKDLEDLLSKEFPVHDRTKNIEGDQTDLNIGALYVEYLTGRAMQSVREALIGAMSLKIASSGI